MGRRISSRFAAVMLAAVMAFSQPGLSAFATEPEVTMDGQLEDAAQSDVLAGMEEPEQVGSDTGRTEEQTYEKEKTNLNDGSIEDAESISEQQEVSVTETEEQIPEEQILKEDGTARETETTVWNDGSNAEEGETEDGTETRILSQISITLTDEETAAYIEQDNPHWIHVQAQDQQPDAEQNSVIRLSLKNKEDNSPALETESYLFAESLETFPETAEAAKAQAKAGQDKPVLLENTVSSADGTGNLNIQRKQEFLKNDAGEYVLDENGNGTVTDEYLEFELPKGGSADFYLALVYRDEQKQYEHTVVVEPEAVWKAEDGSDAEISVLYIPEGQEQKPFTVTWKNAEEAETEVKNEEVNVMEEQVQTTMLRSARAASTVSDGRTYTPEETKALLEFLEDPAHSDYVLLDTTYFTLGNVNWNDKETLYCSIHVGDSNWFGQAYKNVAGVNNVWAWNLGTGNDDKDADFGYSNNWNNGDGNNKNDYYKTEVKKVGELKGHLFKGTGYNTSTSGDNSGRKYYHIDTVAFEKAPISDKTVYLDMTDISGMTAPPKVKIIEGDGTITYREMTLCPEEESVYSYRFDSYVLPGTTFQFVNSAENNAIPENPVANFESAAPCYNGTTWVPYTPKVSKATIHVQYDFDEGVTIVFTKEGNEVKREDYGDSFEFDIYSEIYDGFYVKKKDNTEDSEKTGNRTVIAGREDVRAAVDMHGTAELNAWISTWIGENSMRQISFTSHGTDGDSSLNIPKGVFNRDPDLMYVKSTFYDYYSDVELEGRNRRTCGTPNASNGSNDKLQARNFNSAISNYFAGTALASGENQSPLYFGEFTGASTSGLTNFVWKNNNGVPNTVNGAAGARQGLVDGSLSNGQLTMGGIAAPYFNENFLRGSNSQGTNIGYVFHNVEFPFVKNSKGYWEFDSYNASQTLRMKRDPSGMYFLDRVGAENQVKGHTSSYVTANSNFFPFNDSTESGDWGKLNYAFGARLDIPFFMTKDGNVTIDNTTEHIVFDFSGDDDVWIFIDGQLVLDIGGDHGAVGGKIDFATCTASTTTNDSTANACLGSSYSFDKSLVDPSREHTLTMFYMERGLWESNMKITFNFPQSNELEVEKEVTVPNGLNSWFSEAIKNLNKIEFPVSIENLATTYTHMPITHTLPAVEKEADSITSSTSAFLNTPKTSAVCNVGSGGGRSEVLKYYYPGKKAFTEGQNVTDARSIYVNVVNGGVSFDSPEQIKENGYIQLDTYVDSDVAATDPFIALVDNVGNRVGGWLAGSAYDSTSLSMGSKQWKTLRASIDKLQLLNGNEFNYQCIKQIQFSYHADVTIYIDNVYIKAPPRYEQNTGFTKDDDKIPDYGSRLNPYQLQPVNGAEYIKYGEETPRYVTDGRVYLKNDDKVTFSDQFRRNSYLKLEEHVDSKIFDTTWLLYEDGVLKESGSGTVPADGKNARDENGNEVSDPAKPDGSILFMGESNSLTDYFVKTVKYVNTLKLGDIAIEKALAEGQEDDGRTYTFEIAFSNVAGLMLEGQGNTITKEVTIKAGSDNKALIKGIPAGTQYIIREKKGADDTFTLVNSEHVSGDDGSQIDPITYGVAGVVGGTETDLYKFTNDINESVEINGTKKWQDVSSNEMPASVTLRLQRRLISDSELSYERAKDMQNQVIPDLEVTDATDWEFQFGYVPKYNGTGSGKQEYVYRVIEVKVDGTEVEKTRFSWNGGTAQISQALDGDGETVYDITNTKPPVHLNIEKVDVTDPAVKIGGVTFKLEKLNTDGSTYTQVGEKVTTTDEGLATFDNLQDGTYRLTETNSAEWYSLLESPIIVVIQDNNITIDGQAYTLGSDNTIQYIVANVPKTQIDITKIDAQSSNMLPDVEFKLEKLMDDGSSVDTSFSAMTATTNVNGLASFAKLEKGTYRLTETKAANNYSLLKEPVIIHIDRTENNTSCTVDGNAVTVSENVIALTISNRPNFELPATGGWTRYLLILGGILLAGTAMNMYLLQKRKKGGGQSS